MLLKDKDLLIRNATEGDAGLLCNWWNDGSIMTYTGFPRGLGTTEQEIVEKLKADTDLGRRLIIEIAGIPVGEMNYRTVATGVAQIGIKLCDASQRNKGHGTRFIMMLIRSLLTDMGFQTIILDTNVNNARAQHVYDKIGFRRVAVRRDAWKNQLGVLQSFIDYEITRDEFVSKFPL